MQITLNKIPFDVAPVEGRLLAALQSDPLVVSGSSRDVWAWDGTQGRFLLPVTDKQGLPLPPGLVAFVAQPGTAEAAPRKAEGPTKKMAERFMAAVGAKSFAQLTQGLTRITGLPQKTVPFEAFATLRAHGPHRIRLHVAFEVVELANAARNLQVFLFVPGLVSFSHRMDAPTDEAPAAGSIRPGFVLPPVNQAAHTLRRMAVARRLTEIQAELGETKPADLDARDPRRAEIARLGAEWRVLQPQPAKAA